MPHISQPKKNWTSPHGRPLPQDFWKRTLLMGIVNVTPDSFSDGGDYSRTPDSVAEHACALASAGADIIDLGAESTRPGAESIGADEELRRLIPALKAIRRVLPDMPVSVDTSRAEVALRAIEAGADILNDVCAIRSREENSSPYALGKIAATSGAPLIAMHNRVGNAVYRDFRSEFFDDLRFGIERILATGVPAENLWVDPGFGFGKSPTQNLELVSLVGEIAKLGFPVLLGTSRKSTLGIVLDGKPPKERTGGDSACAAIGAFGGAACLRLHDIAAHRDAVKVADAVFAATRASVLAG